MAYDEALIHVSGDAEAAGPAPPSPSRGAGPSIKISGYTALFPEPAAGKQLHASPYGRSSMFGEGIERNIGLTLRQMSASPFRRFTRSQVFTNGVSRP